MCGSPPEPLTRAHVAQVSARGLANWKGERAEDFSASKTKAPLTITAKYVSWETSEKVDIAKLLLESKSNVTAWFVFTVGQPQDRGLNTKGKAGSSAQRKLDFTYQQPREWWVPSAEHSCVSEIAAGCIANGAGRAHQDCFCSSPFHFQLSSSPILYPIAYPSVLSYQGQSLKIFHIHSFNTGGYTIKGKLIQINKNQMNSFLSFQILSSLASPVLSSQTFLVPITFRYCASR